MLQLGHELVAGGWNSGAWNSEVPLYTVGGITLLLLLFYLLPVEIARRQ